MRLKYIKGNDFEKEKEDEWPKHKAKAPKEDKKEDNDDWQCGGHGNYNEQDDGEWIEVVKGSTNKIIKAATAIPNNNHNNPGYNTTHQSNVYLLREITQQKGKAGSKTKTTNAP